jgi:hypothetical protein
VHQGGAADRQGPRASPVPGRGVSLRTSPRTGNEARGYMLIQTRGPGQRCVGEPVSIPFMGIIPSMATLLDLRDPFESVECLFSTTLLRGVWARGGRQHALQLRALPDHVPPAVRAPVRPARPGTVGRRTHSVPMSCTAQCTSTGARLVIHSTVYRCLPRLPPHVKPI